MSIRISRSQTCRVPHTVGDVSVLSLQMLKCYGMAEYFVASDIRI